MFSKYVFSTLQVPALDWKVCIVQPIFLLVKYLQSSIIFIFRRKHGYTTIPDEENVSDKLTRDKEFQRLALKGSS